MGLTSQEEIYKYGRTLHLFSSFCNIEISRIENSVSGTWTEFRLLVLQLLNTMTIYQIICTNLFCKAAKNTMKFHTPLPRFFRFPELRNNSLSSSQFKFYFFSFNIALKMDWSCENVCSFLVRNIQIEKSRLPETFLMGKLYSANVFDHFTKIFRFPRILVDYFASHQLIYDSYPKISWNWDYFWLFTNYSMMHGFPWHLSRFSRIVLVSKYLLTSKES